MDDAERVAAAIHEAAAHRMGDASWCINAAAIATHVLRALGQKSWPVQCTVLHMNATYADGVARGMDEATFTPWSEAEPGDPYCVWAQSMTRSAARLDEAQRAHAQRVGRDGLAGHVVTYVPGWTAYIDPSAGQFTKPAHSIELGPCAWQGAPAPPEVGHWQRLDGGLSVILPTPLRVFAASPAWTRRGDDDTRRLARRALELLAKDHPDGGRSSDRIPGILRA